MIRVLDEQQCYELLTTTTIGRIGFVEGERVQIFPVNFAVSGRELLLRTASDGPLAAAAEQGGVAFEVDHHDPLGSTAWSVLMHGTLSRATQERADEIAPRVHPWAGGDRELALTFRIENIEGRMVRRESRDSSSL